MGRFDTIKTTIDANIKENGSQEITGQKMNSVLTEMVNATDAELTELESIAIPNNVSLNGVSYSETFENVTGKSIYSCPVKIPQGNTILVSFSASSTIQCVLGVTFTDGTQAQNLATLYTSGEVVSYVAAKDVIKINLYIASSGSIAEFSINAEVKGILEPTKESIPYFERARATDVFYAGLEISFIAGVCSVKFTKTSSSNGYIYHDKGYLAINKNIEKEMTFTTGIVVVYAHANDIALSQSYSDIPFDAVILEIFYSYGGDYTKAIWVSPFIVRNQNDLPNVYCSFGNPKQLALVEKSLNSIDKSLFGGVYSKEYTNIEGGKNYSCSSSVKQGETMEISFSASSTIQCVLGVYFADGTNHFQITTLYNDQAVRYKAEKDVVSTALYISSTGVLDYFTIYVKVKGIAEKIENLGDNGLMPKPKSVKIFQRVGCIGDSYTAGYISTSQGLLNSSPNNAWPHYLEGLTNNRFENWGVSGSTAKGWVLGAANLAKVKQQGNKCQAYMIGLMINDRTNADWNSYYTPVGIKSDIGTDNDSYYAYYYKLVQEVISVNPSAKIFCNTCPKWSENDSYNIAVKDIVAYCKEAGQNVFLLDLANLKYAEMYQDETFAKDYINGHYTAIGYEYMAECYMQVISDVINENVSEFQNVAYIPFDEVVA